MKYLYPTPHVFNRSPILSFLNTPIYVARKVETMFSRQNKIIDEPDRGMI